MILEALPQDAEREPKIKKLCETIEGFDGEVEGHLLNARDGPCVFLNRATDLCSIYPTRPLLYRLFDCDCASREQLIELGLPQEKEKPAS